MTRHSGAANRPAGLHTQGAARNNQAAHAPSPADQPNERKSQAAHGHAWRTLVRARHAEHITVTKIPGRHGPWIWSLPPTPTQRTVDPRSEPRQLEDAASLKVSS